MNNNIYTKLKKVTLIALVTACSFIASELAFAVDRSADVSQERLEEYKKTEGRGWQIKSTGGLLYMNPQDKRFWFALSGVMRLDQTQFSGRARDIRADYPSGGNIRKIEVDLTGGIGPCWNYTIGLDFSEGRHIGISDSWIAYAGFCKNLEIFLGRHSANWFGLENSTSTSWYPFLERSAMAGIFYPGDGLGLLVDYWFDDAGFTFLALQPDQGTKIVTRDGRKLSNDRWMGLFRGTLAPVHDRGNVWHFGLSAVYRQNDATVNALPLEDFLMRTRPEARARNTAQLVSTGELSVYRAYAGNLEIARQCGPWIIQAEYSQGLLRGLGRLFQLGPLHVRGWNIQTQYMLTGEIHEYDVRDGNFGGIDVKTPWGAWEIAARYDYVNLYNKLLRGGKEHDFTVGLNWYVNNNVRVSFNYVRAELFPNPTVTAFPNKRTLDIFAARLQIKFK